jgi:hypothetical protein
MQSAHRIFLLGLVSFVFLQACQDFQESGSSSGPSSPAVTNPANTGGGTTGQTGFSGAADGPGGTKDTVIATPSVPGTVSVTAGASQTISIIFTSSDGLPIHGLAITGATLPADWSGAENYNCTLVGQGSSCVLSLTYAPKSMETGSLTLTYIFIDNANEPITSHGTVTIPYEATAPNNNVVAASSPTGQIVAALGAGSQSVSVSFTTDDGNVATNLTLSGGLASLPPGWSGPDTGFSCAIISSGNGCQLILKYAPTSAASGTLTLGYTYLDNSGTARTGTLNVPYSTATNGTVVATATPMGQVNAVANAGRQSVTITFTTDDGKSANNLLVLSDLTSLPSGWSSASGKLSCGSVSTGNGCQLTLDYAPTAITRGTLTLSYGYLDAGGTYNVGSLNLAYAATTNNNVVGTVAPAGQISAIVGSDSPTATVAFTTDDGRPATGLVVTTDLTALPAGWTSTNNNFGCSGVSGGSGCQLVLTYTPSAAGSGTLTLGYQYDNDAGQAKTGTVSILYTASVPTPPGP